MLSPDWLFCWTMKCLSIFLNFQNLFKGKGLFGSLVICLNHAKLYFCLRSISIQIKILTLKNWYQRNNFAVVQVFFWITTFIFRNIIWKNSITSNQRNKRLCFTYFCLPLFLASFNCFNFWIFTYDCVR